MLPATMVRRLTLVALVASAATTSRAQQALKPMTTIRIAVPAGPVSGRLTALDSSTLTLENAEGKLVTFARRDITSIERRGNYAKRGAKAFGGTGAVVGAVFVGVLAAGLCESTSCEGDALPGALIGGALGGAAGLVVGAGLGAMSAQWVPVSNDVRMKEAIVTPARPCTPRYELQLGNASERSIVGQGGHVSAAATCGRRGVLGAEWGAVDRPISVRERSFADPTYGLMTEESIRKFRTAFAGAFAELPLGDSRFHPHLVASGGIHSVTSELSEVVSQSTPNPASIYAVSQKYPQRNVGGTTHALGLGVGFKSWMPLGPNFAAGLGARMHIVGTDRKMLLESGVSLAYRP